MIMSKIKLFMEKISHIDIIKKDNIIFSGIKRYLKIILIVLLTVIGGITVLYLTVSFLGNAVIFEYTDNEQRISSHISTDFDPKAEGYLMKFPHFANPLMFEGGCGTGNVSFGGMFLFPYSIPIGVDDEKTNIYEAVNDPINVWVFAMSAKYHDRVNIDYTVENDGKTLTVIFSGTAEWESEKIPIEQKFVFDIENADVDNLPRWINEDEVCGEVKEWYKYIFNYGEEPLPSWAEWLIG